MYDLSLFEAEHPGRLEQVANIALGRIIEVDTKNRTCTVSTVTGGRSINNQYIPNVQWLSADANPEGDESGGIPRKGSWGIVHFLDGQAFIGGFMKPLWKSGTTLRGNESVKLNEGDKIISTLAGNRITVKRSGLIEMFASENLMRLIIPTNGQIADLCRTYLMEVDGGSINWMFDELLNTVWDAEYYMNSSRTFLIREEKGFVSADIVYKKVVGPGVPGVLGSSLPVYTQSIGVTGETTTTVTPPLPEGSPSGYKSTIGPDGSIEILAGAAQSIKITADTLGNIGLQNEVFKLNATYGGEFSVRGGALLDYNFTMSPSGAVYLENKAATLNMSSEGDFKVTGPVVTMAIAKTGAVEITGKTFSIKISAAGVIAIEGTKMTMTTKTGFDIKSDGIVNIEGNGPMNIKTRGIVNIDGGPGATGSVLSFPTAISPFTGAPIGPGSATVKVSI
jgi:hypothetical protein